MASKYTLIYINISNCARILNMLESAKIFPNKGKYTATRLFVNVAEDAWNIPYLN